VVTLGEESFTVRANQVDYAFIKNAKQDEFVLQIIMRSTATFGIMHYTKEQADLALAILKEAMEVS